MRLTLHHAPVLSARKKARDNKRQAIFAALVAAQDRGVPVAQSRLAIADEFRVTVEYIRGIEREGIEAQWPPL